MAAVLMALGAVAPRSAQAHPPPFWWMTDMSGTSRAGVELTLGNPDLGPVDATSLTGSMFVEFALSRTFTLYGRMPLTLAFFDPDVAGDGSEAAVGNVSLGLQGRKVRGRHGSKTILGAGFSLYLPTASDGAVAAAARSAAYQLNLPDGGRWYGDTTTVRLRGDARFESRTLFFQTELDLDMQFRDGDDDIDLVAGFGPGIVMSPRFALLLELSIAEITDDEQATLDFGFRYHNHGMMMGMRLYVPLSDPYRDDDVFGLGFDIAGRF